MRFAFTLLFWTVVARWTYGEVSLRFPELVPHVEKLVSGLTPPPAAEWNAEVFVQLLGWLVHG